MNTLLHPKRFLARRVNASYKRSSNKAVKEKQDGEKKQEEDNGISLCIRFNFRLRFLSSVAAPRVDLRVEIC